MLTETTYRWLVALSDLQIALGIDSKEEICQKLGIPGALWETPEPFEHCQSGKWEHITLQPEVGAMLAEGLGEHLSLHEQATYSAKTKPEETDFAIRVYAPIFDESHIVIKALNKLGIEIQPLNPDWEPPKDEDLVRFIQQAKNEMMLGEKSVRKLCELAKIPIPNQISACRAFSHNDAALAQANDWCEKQFGTILSSEITEFCDDDGDTPRIYLNRQALSPLIGMDQQIRFTPLGIKITRLGIVPLRTTCAIISTK